MQQLTAGEILNAFLVLSDDGILKLVSFITFDTIDAEGVDT